jgi:hypothetical protein
MKLQEDCLLQPSFINSDYMNRYLPFILVFLVSHFALLNVCAAYDDDYSSFAPILGSAETFFISLRNSEYGAAWDLLSEKSHDTIISDVYEVSRKMNRDINREDIIRDFNNKGTMFTNYWNSFLWTFDADMILEQSRWEMGLVRKDKAEILITYNKSHRPTILTMLREKDAWRVGLVETFWQRKNVKLLRLIFQ